jgi:hypothetical protein
MSRGSQGVVEVGAVVGVVADVGMDDDDDDDGVEHVGGKADGVLGIIFEAVLVLLDGCKRFGGGSVAGFFGGAAGVDLDRDSEAEVVLATFVE